MPPHRSRHGLPPRSALAALVLSVTILTSCGATSRTSSASFASFPTVVPGWRLYRDASGLFTMAIPAGWGVDHNTSTAPMTIYGQTFTTSEVDVRLGEPLGGATSAALLPSASVFLYIIRIEGETQQEAWCHNWKPDTTVGQFPAMRLPLRNLSVDTTAAVYQISYTLPNDSGSASGPPVVPSVSVTAAQNAITQAIASFQPIPLTPLRC